VFAVGTNYYSVDILKVLKPSLSARFVIRDIKGFLLNIFRKLCDLANCSKTSCCYESNGSLPKSKRVLKSSEHLRAELRRNRNDFLHEKIIVLGSGPSLNELDFEPFKTSFNVPFIAMNRYILFWEQIGIWPSYFFLADNLGAGLNVFNETMRRIERQSELPKPTLILEEFYRNCVFPQNSAIFFNRDDRLGSNLQWAENPFEPMFFHRGSLSSLLNVIAAYRLARSVFIAGVDLNRPGYFFDNCRTNFPEFFNPWDDQAYEKGHHATAISVNGWEGSILDHWSIINDNYARLGIGLYSVDDSSLLVKNGLVRFLGLNEIVVNS
jgi:hypothetical protein